MNSNIMVASFTVTAAQEIAGRGLPVNRRNVGTLHSLAYRAIGAPPVAEEHLKDWNRRHPEYVMSAAWRPTTEEPSPPEFLGEAEGDVVMHRLDHLRARMVPEESWPLQVRSFHRKWSQWKTDAGVVDFTDMIDRALSETIEAPGEPVVGYFDEVQDFTPLELALVRHWGRRMERVILGGDDDQCLYRFKGSTPDAFLDPPISDDRKYILDQSYRVPRAVHRVAQRWVEHLSRREPKDYKPRDFEGAVRMSPYGFSDPTGLVRDVQRHVDEGRTVMILASCGYMLDPVKHKMRQEGVAFGNPYRRHRKDWNPLQSSRGSSGAEKLYAYLVLDERVLGSSSRPWTGQDVKAWTSVVVKKGLFKRGAAGAIAGLPDRELTYEEVARLFEDDSNLDAALEPSLDWFQENLLAASRSTMEYPIRVARRRGYQALRETPRVCLGTIHSVKGGQADVVYLFPDLSGAGMREWQSRGELRDSVIRLMYVGMTRAREELVICQNSTPFTVDPGRMLRG